MHGSWRRVRRNGCLGITLATIISFRPGGNAILKWLISHVRRSQIQPIRDKVFGQRFLDPSGTGRFRVVNG